MAHFWIWLSSCIPSWISCHASTWLKDRETITSLIYSSLPGKLLTLGRSLSSSKQSLQVQPRRTGSDGGGPCAEVGFLYVAVSLTAGETSTNMYSNKWLLGGFPCSPSRNPGASSVISESLGPGRRILSTLCPLLMSRLPDIWDLGIFVSMKDKLCIPDCVVGRACVLDLSSPRLKS